MHGILDHNENAPAALKIAVSFTEDPVCRDKWALSEFSKMPICTNSLELLLPICSYILCLWQKKNLIYILHTDTMTTTGSHTSSKMSFSNYGVKMLSSEWNFLPLEQNNLIFKVDKVSVRWRDHKYLPYTIKVTTTPPLSLWNTCSGMWIWI